MQTWKVFLLSARNSKGFPLLVGLLSIFSSGTALYPFAPVLVAALVFAPTRWRSIYLASALGAAIGAGSLTLAIQWLGNGLLSAQFQSLDALPHWLGARQLVEGYGAYAIAAVAALPVPQIPVLVALALAGTPPWQIALAILAGKLVKYGVYVLGTQLVLGAIHHRQRHG